MPAWLLGDYRSKLRLDLFDPAGASQRFADADLNRAIEAAQRAYEKSLGRLRTTTLSTVATSRDVAITSLTDIQTVLRVEWPTGKWPKEYPAYSVSPDRATLTLHVTAAPAAVENVIVIWTSPHTLDAVTSTIPIEHEQMLIRGAYGYACLSFSTPLSDNFKYQDGDQFALVDDSMIPREWRTRGRQALDFFFGLIREEYVLRSTRLIDGAAGRVTWSKKRPAPRWPTGPEREP